MPLELRNRDPKLNYDGVSKKPIFVLLDCGHPFHPQCLGDPPKCPRCTLSSSLFREREEKGGGGKGKRGEEEEGGEEEGTGGEEKKRAARREEERKRGVTSEWGRKRLLNWKGTMEQRRALEMRQLKEVFR